MGTIVRSVTNYSVFCDLKHEIQESQSEFKITFKAGDFCCSEIFNKIQLDGSHDSNDVVIHSLQMVLIDLLYCVKDHCVVIKSGVDGR